MALIEVSGRRSLHARFVLQEWKMVRSKGCFYYNERDKIIGHQYSLRTTQDSSVWITIEPLCIMDTGWT